MQFYTVTHFAQTDTPTTLINNILIIPQTIKTQSSGDHKLPNSHVNSVRPQFHGVDGYQRDGFDNIEAIR